MLNGLDLFSGIGGMSIALKDWVRTIAYCEIDPYCQAVLLSQMGNGSIPIAPLLDDIRELSPFQFGEDSIDIVSGGFPCQDISIAGRGKGLEGERSSLFFEIMRLAKEIKPPFLFLENVPAITSRGGIQVVETIAEMGYDCRWCVISAASIGAPHLRERWFLLAHASSMRFDEGASEGIYPERQSIEHEESSNDSSEDERRSITHADSERISEREQKQARDALQTYIASNSFEIYWEETEPPFCGVDDAIPNRAHRIRALGNAVVPGQAKKAFKILMGLS